MPINQSSANTKTEILVEGMSCSACAARIENALKEVPGVFEAHVNFATARSTISHHPETTKNLLVKTISDLGYTTPKHIDGTEIHSRQEKFLKIRLIPAISAAVISMVLTMAISSRLGDIATATLATISVFWCGSKFHRAARIQLLQASLGMDFLVSLGTLASWLWSFIALLSGSQNHLYFDAASVITAFVLLGKWWEARATLHSGAALHDLAASRNQKIRLIDGSDVTLDSLQIGAEFIVRPGETVATDGTVVTGISDVDTAMLTGESQPRSMTTGDLILGGSINGDGTLTIRATAIGADTAAAKIVRLVEEAQGSKAPVQKMADRIAQFFIPCIIVLAIGTLTVRLLIGHQSEDAFTAAVAILIVSCPCALGLATPLAVLVGTGKAAKLGIIIRSAAVLEDTRRVTHIVLDKTGTITNGDLCVAKIITPNGNKELLMDLAAALESRSEHPIARAISSSASNVLEIKNFKNFPGLGIEGEVAGVYTRVGKANFFEDMLPELRSEIEHNDSTHVLVGRGQTAEAIILLSDEVRPTAKVAVAKLKKMGIKVTLLSGDNKNSCNRVANEISISRVISEVLPDAKQTEISRLQATGDRVAMVGDGINDAPALAKADLGIVMGSGSDLAHKSASLIVVNNDLLSVVDGIALSRQTMKTIRVNLFWAFLYNVLAIPLAMSGMLHPIHASAAMALSSTFVVSNSLRLRRYTAARSSTFHVPRHKSN